jgi:chromate transporter
VESQWRWLRRRAWLIAHGEPLAGWRRWLRDRDDDLFALAPLSLPLMGPGFPGAWRALGDLCGIFLRAGATTFGGGFVMIPLLENELVRARGWLTPDAFADAMALGQITPGPVVISATFVGYTLSGLTGALLATLAVFLPAFLMVIVIGGSAQRFRQMSGVQSFLQGLQPAVVGVMFAASIALLRSAGITPFSIALALVAFAVLALWRISSAWVLLGGSLVGVAARALGV